MRKRLALLVAATAALAAAAAFTPSLTDTAQACGGTVSCCDSSPAGESLLSSALELLAIENAAACAAGGEHSYDFCVMEWYPITFPGESPRLASLCSNPYLGSHWHGVSW